MANISKEGSLNAAHISTNLANYEAARSSFFSFIIDDIDNLPVPGVSWQDDELYDKITGNAGEYVRLNVVKCDVPHFSVAVNEYRRGNDVVKWAGLPSFQAGSIVVDDIVGLDTKSILMAWQGLTYNVDDRTGGLMKDYKKTCTLVEYTQAYKVIRKWTLYGCFISGLQEGEFDREADGKRQITATIEYDRAVMSTADSEVIAKAQA